MARLVDNLLVLAVLAVLAVWYWTGVPPWEGWLGSSACQLTSLAEGVQSLAQIGFVVGLAIWLLSSFRFQPGGAIAIVALLISTATTMISGDMLGACGTTWSM